MEKKHVWVIAALLLAALAVSALPLACTSCSATATDRPTMLYFRSDLWAYCKQMNPIVDGIRRKYKGQLNVVYADMERSDGKKLAKEQDVVGTPTLVLLDSESNRVNVLRGSLPATLIEQAVENLVANQAASN